MIPEKPQAHKSKAPEVVECLCTSKIPEKEIIIHAKKCTHCKALLGTLPDSIDNILKEIKDVQAFKFLFYLLGNARNQCKEKIKGIHKSEPKVEYPFQMKETSPVNMLPPPIIKQPSIPIQPAQPIQPMAIPNEEGKEGSHKHDHNSHELTSCDMIDENSILCKICNTRFLDFNQILYLQSCLHTYCKNDLKILCFTYFLFY